MRISTKGRYALRLMLDLAMEENGKPVSIKDIAGRQGISEKYLEQIISSLNKAGYVKSVRGAQGGYLLKMEPKDYTVGMILRVTEGSLAPVDCAWYMGNFSIKKAVLPKRIPINRRPFSIRMEQNAGCTVVLPGLVFSILR